MIGRNALSCLHNSAFHVAYGYTKELSYLRNTLASSLVRASSVFAFFELQTEQSSCIHVRDYSIVPASESRKHTGSARPIHDGFQDLDKKSNRFLVLLGCVDPPKESDLDCARA